MINNVHQILSVQVWSCKKNCDAFQANFYPSCFYCLILKVSFERKWFCQCWTIGQKKSKKSFSFWSKMFHSKICKLRGHQLLKNFFVLNCNERDWSSIMSVAKSVFDISRNFKTLQPKTWLANSSGDELTKLGTSLFSRSAAAGIVLPTSLTQLGLNPDWQLATIFVSKFP